MSLRDLIPRVGWFDLDRDETLQLDLHPAYRWQAFGIRWPAWGVVLTARRVEYRRG